MTLHCFKGDEAPSFLDKIRQLRGREAGGSGCLVVGTRGKYLASGHNSAYSLLPSDGQDRAAPIPSSHATAATSESGWTTARNALISSPIH